MLHHVPCFKDILFRLEYFLILPIFLLSIITKNVVIIHLLDVLYFIIVNPLPILMHGLVLGLTDVYSSVVSLTGRTHPKRHIFSRRHYVHVVSTLVMILSMRGKNRLLTSASEKFLVLVRFSTVYIV